MKNKAMQKWLSKHGVGSIEEAQGKPVVYTGKYIQDNSELANVIQATIVGDRVRLYDDAGWCEEYAKADLDALVLKHGKLAEWDDMSELGKLKSKDVS